ncbi:MAG: hypothetical protein FVQ82_02390 [Planctomycetes bacterium]|nr:hypothetical protein [Planctomycetota bacterium]
MYLIGITQGVVQNIGQCIILSAGRFRAGRRLLSLNVFRSKIGIIVLYLSLIRIAVQLRSLIGMAIVVMYHLSFTGQIEGAGINH